MKDFLSDIYHEYLLQNLPHHSSPEFTEACEWYEEHVTIPMHDKSTSLGAKAEQVRTQFICSSEDLGFRRGFCFAMDLFLDYLREQS